MSAKIGTLEEAVRYAERIAEFADEPVSPLSDNERRILALAREVERLQQEVVRRSGGAR